MVLSRQFSADCNVIMLSHFKLITEKIIKGVKKIFCGKNCLKNRIVLDGIRDL